MTCGECAYCEELPTETQERPGDANCYRYVMPNGDDERPTIITTDQTACRNSRRKSQ